jgi:hypothetical protein
MAQDTVQGQGVVQTVKVQKPFRDTGYGGYTKTWIISAGGQIVKPTRSERSKSGRHGWDIWQLGNGQYAVITANRPNIRNGPKPFEVSIKCIEVTNGELKVLASRTMYVMDFEINDLREWARGIC